VVFVPKTKTVDLMGNITCSADKKGFAFVTSFTRTKTAMEEMVVKLTTNFGKK
jgi:hypothetical protein